MSKLLVTAALPYANGAIHLGHMIEQVQADIWVRWQRLQENDCIFICGDDAHGTPIMLSARQQNMTPEALIAAMQKEHEQDSAAFDISFDNYYTTHSPENQALAEAIYRKLQAHGDIEIKSVTQAYDPVANMFLPDRFVRGTCPKCHAPNQHGDNCEVCGATYSPSDLQDATSVISGSVPIKKASEHYFFKLEKYEAMLQEWVQSGALPTTVTHKLQEWFKQGLKPWDISRDAPYFGFLIPDTTDKYFYVWLDAPIGYMASFKKLCARRPDLNFDAYWERDSKVALYHFIGKDICYFHTLFWPAMLEASGMRKPTAVFVHGYLTVDGQKMSKSRGTFILARDYVASGLNPEYLRYYYAAKLDSSIDDIDLNLHDFAQRVNSDLVGKVVNIASRCAGFISKGFNNQLAAELDNLELFAHCSAESAAIADAYTKLEYGAAVRMIMALADKANQYIDEKKPWQLAKQDPTAAAVQNICTMGLNLFRLLALYLKPILPKMIGEAEQFLNIAPLVWGDQNQPLLNHTINAFHPLMQRVDLEKVKALAIAK
jgi:methionyl-tRNA synthetase